MNKTNKILFVITIVIIIIALIAFFCYYNNKLKTAEEDINLLVLAVDEQNRKYEEPLNEYIKSHIPYRTLKAFKDHGGEIIINSNDLGIAGRTYNAFDAKGRAIFDYKCYMELSPDFGESLLQSTALHEFGYVLDLATQITYDSEVSTIIKSEIDSYNKLVELTEYSIPEYFDEHELFAQVHAAVLGLDGTQPWAKEIIKACPNTTKIIKDMYNIK